MDLNNSEFWPLVILDNYFNKVELNLSNFENNMQNLLQRDLGSSLLSIAVILGWLGLFFVFAISFSNK